MVELRGRSLHWLAATKVAVCSCMQLAAWLQAWLAACLAACSAAWLPAWLPLPGCLAACLAAWLQALCVPPPNESPRANHNDSLLNALHKCLLENPTEAFSQRFVKRRPLMRPLTRPLIVTTICLRDVSNDSPTFEV